MAAVSKWTVRFVPVLCVFLLGTPRMESANILFAYPVAVSSHANVFLPIVEALANRGHNVTLFTSLPPNRKLPGNVREIVPPTLSNMFGIIFNDSFSALKNPWAHVKDSIRVATYWCERIMGDETYMRELWNAEDNYDLIILSAIANECLYGLIWRSRVPFAMVSPTGMFPWVGAAMGNPSYFPAAPSVFLISSSNRMNFWERLENWAVIYLYRVLYHFSTGSQVTDVLRRYLPDFPHPSVVTANASLLLLNTDISVDYPRPHLPTIKEIGGLHCRDAVPLPDDLEDFVTKPGSQGFIYFSLGTTVKGIHVPKEFRKVFVDVFRHLPEYQVLWKWEDDTVEGEMLPPNVRLAKWLPQQDLLGHERIKLFITQGGLLSTHEATYHGVPIVGIPVGSDQLLNMRRSVVAGVGLMISWEELTYESLLEAIKTVLSDTSYADNVRERSAIMKDQETAPLDRAVFWIEYILRHNGAPHLKSSLPELAWCEAHGLDIAAFVITVLSLFLAISVSLTVCCIRCTWRRSKALCRKLRGHSEKKDQ